MRTRIEIGMGPTLLHARTGAAWWWLPMLLLLATAATLPAGDFGYTLNTNATITITNYTGCGGAVAIPSAIEGKTVTSIGDQAFYNCTRLVSVTIPASIASIGNQAFDRCTSLTDVTIPNNVTSIGNQAFAECTSLVVITVDVFNSAFCSVDGVLFNRSKNTLIQCPAGKAGNYMIPNSVTSIGSQAFFRCANLTAINVDAGNTVYGSVSGILFNKSKNTLIQCPAGKTGSIAIPTSVTSIGDYAFGWCSGLTGVTIPGSVISIGSQAFLGCNSLGSITIPNSVTSIGSQAFYACAGLAGITIPNSVVTIGSQAFGNCARLTSVTIPNSVAAIGSQAFGNCISLTAIAVDLGNSLYTSLDGVLFNKNKTMLIQYPGRKAGNYAIPAGVTAIGNNAFDSCTALTGVSVPYSVTSIDSLAFYRCTSLNAITVDAANHVYCSVDGILLNKNKTTLIQCPGGKVGSYTIPNSVTSIGDNAFDSCTALTNVTIPNNVAGIGNSAFSRCSSLTGVTIPNSVTAIGDQAFFCCAGLTAFAVNLGNPAYASLDGVLFNKNKTTLIQCPGSKAGSYTIPNSVTNIGDYAFDSCNDLTGVTIPAGVAAIGLQAFSSCTSLTAINVDSGNPVYSSVAGILYNKIQTTLIQFPGGKAGTVTIPAGVTSIGYWAFFSCPGLAAIDVNAGNPIYSSAYGVLLNKSQSALIEYPPGKTGSVTIPVGITSIGDHAFYSCPGLTAINVDTGNTIFSGAEGILFNKNQTTLIQCPAGKTGSVTIPAGVAGIGNSAFYACAGLAAIDVNAGNPAYSSVDGVLFNKNQTMLIQCPGGKTGNVTIPDGVIGIGDGAFSSGAGLTDVTIPAGLATIGDGAFENCAMLAIIYFRGNAPSIGTKVFDNDDNATVYYAAGTTGWGPTFGGRPTAVWNATLPTPIIKANDTAGEITVNYTDPVSITVEMNAGGYAGVPVDWWIIAHAESSWYYMNSSMQWMQYDGNLSNCDPVYQGGLFNLPATEALYATWLQAGSYTVWFAVDYPMDGTLNLDGQVLLDSVKIIVQ